MNALGKHRRKYTAISGSLISTSGMLLSPRSRSTLATRAAYALWRRCRQPVSRRCTRKILFVNRFPGTNGKSIAIIAGHGNISARFERVTTCGVAP
jgi:hypothetical protein